MVDRENSILKGFKCPKCKNASRFDVEMGRVACVEMEDEDDRDSGGYWFGEDDESWTGDSFCACGECGHEGVVSDFNTTVDKGSYTERIEELEAALQELLTWGDENGEWETPSFLQAWKTLGIS